MHITKQWEYLSGWDEEEGFEEGCQTLLFGLDSRAFCVPPHGFGERHMVSKILFGNQWFSAYCLVPAPNSSSLKFEKKKKSQEKQVCI